MSLIKRALYPKEYALFEDCINILGVENGKGNKRVL